MTPQERLQEIRQRISLLANQPDLDDNEVKELSDLNKEAAKLSAKIEATKQVEALKAQEKQIADEETEKKIEEAVKREREKYEVENRRPDFSGGAGYQAQFSDTWKYDNLSAPELSLAIEMGKNLGVQFPPAAMKAMSLKVSELKDNNTEESRKNVAYIKGAFKALSQTHIEPTKEAIEAAVKAATDPMYTGGSLIGSDWVGTAYATAIWEAIRAENRIASKIPSIIIEDGNSSKVIPVESTDMTWYKVSEATASDSTLKVPAATIVASQMATAKKQITVGKIGARGIYTGELTEDSIIKFAPQLREQLETSGAEIVDHLFIDGDVETSANKNINNIDGTPTSTDVFLTFDGFRKLALVTNTANSRSASGSLTIDDFLATMQLMGTAGLAGVNPALLGFILDGNSYYAAARLPEVKTKDVNSAATIENGFLGKAWGVSLIPSWQMHRASAKRMANTSGKISGTDSNNTTGAILCVRWDQWKQAFKRRMTIETTRIANADSYEIVALARLGLVNRDDEAAAITYNVGV